MPLAGQRQVDAVIVFRMCFRKIRHLPEPGAGHHDTVGISQAILEYFFGGAIFTVRQSGIVGVDHEEAGIGGVG